MVYVYSLEYYDYVCLHQDHYNNLFQYYRPEPGYPHEEICSIQTIQLNSERVSEIADVLQAHINSQGVLMWDMRTMEMSRTHEIESVIQLLDKQYQGICFLQDDAKLGKLISEELQEYQLKHNANVQKEEDKYIFKSIEENCFYLGREVNEETLSNHIGSRSVGFTIDEDINKYFFKAIEEYDNKEKEKEKKEGKGEEQSCMQRNYSSNVFVNSYFDAKYSLLDAPLFNLVVYRMAIMINNSLNKIYKEESFDAFVCASITGACLATGLSAYFHKPVIYLKNVGPSIMADDERMIARIEKNKQYLFVFDFMCLGKEYERMKMLCKLKSAHIACCAGISYYRLPRFKDAEQRSQDQQLCFDWNTDLRISALFQINAFNSEYYYCKVQNNEEDALCQ